MHESYIQPSLEYASIQLPEGELQSGDGLLLVCEGQTQLEMIVETVEPAFVTADKERLELPRDAEVDMAVVGTVLNDVVNDRQDRIHQQREGDRRAVLFFGERGIQKGVKPYFCNLDCDDSPVKQFNREIVKARRLPETHRDKQPYLQKNSVLSVIIRSLTS